MLHVILILGEMLVINSVMVMGLLHVYPLQRRQYNFLIIPITKQLETFATQEAYLAFVPRRASARKWYEIYKGEKIRSCVPSNRLTLLFAAQSEIVSPIIINKCGRMVTTTTTSTISTISSISQETLTKIHRTIKWILRIPINRPINRPINSFSNQIRWVHLKSPHCDLYQITHNNVVGFSAK